ncbi:oligosaccharide flippase family protein [Mammaliicoccus sciuri]|uniref:oligosaccharide flippase family protein n=1 Tax=Mammaliicoccus sciuri TaxID=1296 RepID=UPI002B25DC58|nr:oligosaccharide flippase family protein [Mammaliicoccus sciuri]WQK90238.1 oligosaccharide flippase family protein [Mammaliicoccus sciuri]
MIKDSFLYLLSKFLPAIISFGIIYLYLTKMSPKEYGVFSITIVSVGLINIVSTQWIRSGMVRYFSIEKSIMNTLITIQIYIIIITSIIALLILLIIDFDGKYILLFILILMNINVNEFLNNYYRTIIRPSIILYGNIIKNLLYIFFICVFIMSNTSLNIYIALFSYFLGVFISNIYYFIYWDFKFNLEMKKSHLKKLAIYGIPLTISFSLGVLLQNIDKYLITLILGIEANGNYALIYDFIHNSLYMVMGALGLASLPRIINLSDPKNQFVHFNQYVNVFYTICVPILFTFLSVSNEMTFIFNKYGYKISESIIIFVIISTFIHGINSFIYSQAIQMLEKTTMIILPSFLAIVVSVFMNLVLLPKIGLLSAAISSLIAFLTSNLVLYLVMKKKAEIKFYPKSLIFLFIIGLAIILIISHIEFSNIYITLIIKCTIVIGIYISFIYVFLKKQIKL